MDPIVNPSAPRYIPVARPSLGRDEAGACHYAILDGWVSGGPRVAEFERQFSADHGKRHGVASNSGTTALHLALVAANVGPGDQVIIPTLTMVAVANAVLYCGATPVFVDSHPFDGNQDSKWLERVRAANRQTKAVIVVHHYGVPAERFLDGIFQHCPHAKIIEDCAEAHYASYSNSRPVGSRGDLACFSFYGNKIVTCGEGGMVLTNDDQTAERLRQLRAHAFTPGDHFHHQELAFGYRMTEMQAAIGLVQHKRRHEFLQRRDEIAERYTAGLSSVSWLKPFPQSRPLGSVWWVFPILADSRERRDRCRHILAERGIDTRTFFVPLHRQPHLRRYADGEYPVADDLSARGVYLPLWPGMSDEDVGYVIEAVGRV